MLGDDGQFYVAKFQGNPQGNRTLINEWIGGKLCDVWASPPPRFGYYACRITLTAMPSSLTLRMAAKKLLRVFILALYARSTQTELQFTICSQTRLSKDSW